MNKVIIGAALIILGLSAVIYWWEDVFVLIRGFAGLFLIILGAIAIIIAKK